MKKIFIALFLLGFWAVSAQDVVNVGTGANMRNGDKLRDAFVKINDKFAWYDAIETVSRTIYVNDTTGNDLTGAGTQELPFKTLLKALQNVKPLVGHTTYIYVQKAHNDSLYFTPAEQLELLKKRMTYSYGALAKLVIQGNTQLLLNNVTPGISSPDSGRYTYTASWPVDTFKHCFLSTVSSTLVGDLLSAPIYSSGSNFVETIPGVGSTYKYIHKPTTVLNIVDAASNSLLLNFSEHVEFRGFNIVFKNNNNAWFRDGKTRFAMTKFTFSAGKGISLVNQNGIYLNGVILTKSANNSSVGSIISITSSSNPNIPKISLDRVLVEYPSLSVNNNVFTCNPGLITANSSIFFVNCNSILVHYSPGDAEFYQTMRLKNCNNVIDYTASGAFTSNIHTNTVIKTLQCSGGVKYILGKIGNYNTHFTIKDAVIGPYTAIWNPAGSNYNYYSVPENDFCISGQFVPNETIVNGSTSGTIKWRMPLRGASKKLIIQFNAFNDAGEVVTYPIAFSTTPAVSVNTTGLTISTITSTAITIPATAGANGWIILEGF